MELFIQLVISILITALAYLFVPMIFLTVQKKLEIKIIKRIAIINSVAVWLLFQIINIEVRGGKSSGAAVFLWGYIGYKLLEKFCQKEDEKTEENDQVKETSVHVCISDEREGATRQYGRYNVCGEDIRLDKTEIQEPVSICTERVCSNEPVETNRIDWKIMAVGILSILLAASCILNVALIVSKDNTNNTVKNDSSYITYESYYAGVRMITVSNKQTAERIYKEWKTGKATENTMIEIMDFYGAEQGGGNIYIGEPGDWVDELDNWIFDRTRQIGDVAIIKNPYGYTICYFSAVIRR